MKLKRLIDLIKLDKLDYLIRRAETGNPDELAKRLEMARSCLFDLITFLKEEMQAPIYYDKDKRSYAYSYTTKFFLGFERERLENTEMKSAYGCGEETEKKNTKIIIEIDKDDYILDDDIDFNDLYH